MDPNGSTTLTFVATVALFAFIFAGDGLGPRLQLEPAGAAEIFAGINCACGNLHDWLNAPYYLIKSGEISGTSDKRYHK